MKCLLSVLLSFILLQSQVFALSGGPDYNRGGGGSGVSDIVGTYGGVMVEQNNPIDGTNGGSIAVYSVNIVRSGTSTGDVLIFNAGRVYPGTVSGVGDSSSSVGSTFRGIIEASFNYTLSTIATNPITGVRTVLTQEVTTTTNGTINTDLETVRNGFSSNILMSGNANLLVSNGFVDNNGNLDIQREIPYDVSGFRQSVATAGTATTAL